MSTLLIETKNVPKKVVLGERDLRVHFRHVIHYEVFAQGKDFYIRYFVIINGQITEYIRRIKKETAITMLARMQNINEEKINEYIPYFETKKQEIQLHDRIHDFESILTDREVYEKINQVVEFHFFGEHRFCGRTYPHIPHVIGEYDTVRYGKLPVFCTGKSGTLLLQDGKKVQILITKNCSEGCSGRYVLLELEE